MIPRCQTAALRTYRDLRASGAGDPAAFSAAVRVFRLHHPEFSGRAALDMVAGWIDDQVTAQALPAGDIPVRRTA